MVTVPGYVILSKHHRERIRIYGASSLLEWKVELKKEEVFDLEKAVRNWWQSLDAGYI